MKTLTRALAVAVFAMIAAPSFAALMNPPPASHPVTMAQATTERTGTNTITIAKTDAAVAAVHLSPELGAASSPSAKHFDGLGYVMTSTYAMHALRRPLAGPGDDEGGEDDGDAGTPPTGAKRLRL
jgi:hypothetical protein